MQHRMIMTVAAAAVLVTAGCASTPQAQDGGATTPVDSATSADDAGDAAAATAQVTIQSFIYDPTPLEVEVGTTVTWSNEDKILHTATSGTPEAPSGVFDIAMAEVGTSGEFTFDEAGTYDYFCSRHTSMRGQVVVS